MINYEQVFRASIGPAVGILVISILGYKILRSRRFKNWLAAKRGLPVENTDNNDKAKSHASEGTAAKPRKSYSAKVKKRTEAENSTQSSVEAGVQEDNNEASQSNKK